MSKSIERDNLIAEYASQAAKTFGAVLRSYLHFYLDSYVWLIVAQVLQANASPKDTFSDAIEIYLDTQRAKLRSRVAIRRRGRRRDRREDLRLLKELEAETITRLEANPAKDPGREHVAEALGKSDGTWIGKLLKRTFSDTGIGTWKDFCRETRKKIKKS